MLYHQKNVAGNTLLGIWKIEESQEELLSLLDHKDWLDQVFSSKSEARKTEMLATRVLLKEMLGEENQICYFKSGKPFLADNTFQISISHTKGFVAIVLDKHKTMGLDIEQRTNKILRVRDRITTRYDYIEESNEQTHLLLHWSAKEAMFKYLNTSEVDFRRDLHIEPFTPNKKGIFRVSESKTKKRQQFDAHYIVDDYFVLVCLVTMNT